ncbi:MAG: hypothetical protein IKH26_01755 [Bacteroidaceae bacterium]|nr:hypothetical protein [Bacteroidaceae bacterium]
MMEEEIIQQQPKPKDNFKKWDDPIFNDLRKLFSRAKLREVLTHTSYYEQQGKDDGKGNSRYVFAGMFVFKGQVGEVLFRYATGEGTRLQHILGNLFRNERLERQFDEWRLGQFARAGEKFDIKTHKHIFVYAIYGYVSTLDENIRQWFISKYLINDAKHLLGHKHRNRNLLAQADDIVNKMDGRRLTIVMERTEEGLHKAKTVLSDGTLLCEAESKSWRYARQKAAKMALDILAMPARNYILSNPEYHARVLARKEEEKARRKAEVEARQARKEEIRLMKKEQRKAEAKLRDAKRRKSQAEAKIRKAENARKAAIKAAKEARPMSGKKRRYLEDKKK